MFKLGRNDLCTCGSGKKYKKCCGKNVVVSLDSLIDHELQEIQVDILGFSMKNYQDELDEYLEDFYADMEIPVEAEELINFFAWTWFITSVELDGKTIMAEYIDRYSNKINRKRIKEILQSWRFSRPSVYIVQQQDENQELTLQDIFSEDVHKVKVFEEGHIVEPGALVLGTLLPAGTGAAALFFTTFFDTPVNQAEELKKTIFTLYDMSEEETPADFMAISFLEILDYFIFGKPEVTIENLNWNSPKQKEVAENFRNYMTDVDFEASIIGLGLFLWNQYCLRRNPTIIKTSVYEAALLYLIDSLHPLGGEITQKELAEEFHVSSSSISAKYKDLEDVLSDEVFEIRNILDDYEVMYDDDIFDEDDDFFDEDDDFDFEGDFDEDIDDENLFVEDDPSDDDK